MRLAFDNQAHYTDFSAAYQLYLNRCRDGNPVDEKTYRRVLKAYCKMMAERLEEDGMVDLPNELGMLSVANIRRRGRWADGKFVGYGGYDWKNNAPYNDLKTFGIVYLPKHGKGNLRCYGFVANRKLFQRMKEKYVSGASNWALMEFNDEMI